MSYLSDATLERFKNGMTAMLFQEDSALHFKKTLKRINLCWQSEHALSFND
jgi:hypothetical protein